MFEEVNQTAARESREVAEKHGFYWSSLSEQERINYEIAFTFEGLDNEIALLRVKLKTVLESVQSLNINAIVRAVNTLERLLKTKKTVFKKDDSAHLEDAIRNVFRSMPIPPQYIAEKLAQQPSS